MSNTSYQRGVLFPAYAGVIPTGTTGNVPLGSFPRIRGGDPADHIKDTGTAWLFPAYAGVIPISKGALSLCKTFPRIRGGDPSPE